MHSQHNWPFTSNNKTSIYSASILPKRPWFLISFSASVALESIWRMIDIFNQTLQTKVKCLIHLFWKYFHILAYSTMSVTGTQLAQVCVFAHTFSFFHGPFYLNYWHFNNIRYRYPIISDTDINKWCKFLYPARCIDNLHCWNTFAVTFLSGLTASFSAVDMSHVLLFTIL